MSCEVASVLLVLRALADCELDINEGEVWVGVANIALFDDFGLYDVDLCILRAKELFAMVVEVFFYRQAQLFFVDVLSAK